MEVKPKRVEHPPGSAKTDLWTEEFHFPTQANDILGDSDSIGCYIFCFSDPTYDYDD